MGRVVNVLHMLCLPSGQHADMTTTFVKRSFAVSDGTSVNERLIQNGIRRIVRGWSLVGIVMFGVVSKYGLYLEDKDVWLTLGALLSYGFVWWASKWFISPQTRKRFSDLLGRALLLATLTLAINALTTGILLSNPLWMPPILMLYGALVAVPLSLLLAAHVYFWARKREQ